MAKRFDAAEFLETPEDIVAYLHAARGENDPNLLMAALGDVVCAEGMSAIARQSGLTG
jgi:probable addiction module antidote protein